MNNAQYGARRIVISRPDRATEYRVAADGWAPDLLSAVVAEGLPPFTYLSVQVKGWPDWRTVSSVQTRPQPGWAHPAATYCPTCGVVAFDGAILPCNH